MRLWTLNCGPSRLRFVLSRQTSIAQSIDWNDSTPAMFVLAAISPQVAQSDLPRANSYSSQNRKRIHAGQRPIGNLLIARGIMPNSDSTNICRCRIVPVNRLRDAGLRDKNNPHREGRNSRSTTA